MICPNTNKVVILIGIVGTGRTAVGFLSEAECVGGVKVIGVFSPDEKWAKQFADKFNLFLESDYKKLLEKVDAVYITSPYETHYDYAKTALAHGKHVLCEKPMAFRKDEAKELFARAKKMDCVLMESIETAYCTGFRELISKARSGVIGEIRDVEAGISRFADTGCSGERERAHEEAFIRFGSYAMLPILKLLGKEYKEIRFDSLKNDKGVNMYTKVSFVYDNGFAMAKISADSNMENQLVIAGTEGYILAKHTWWLTQSFEVRFENPDQRERYSFEMLEPGDRYGIRNFVKAITGDREQVFGLTAEESIAMAQIMEEFLKQCKGNKSGKTYGAEI